MQKAVLISFLVAVCAVYCASASQEESIGVRSQGAATPQKKLRLLYGSVPARGYRFRSGQASSLDDDVLFGDEDPSVVQKRQYDDYGHMRFGKRNPKDFDDYGHLRFGK